MFHRNYTDLVTPERVKVQVSPGKRGQVGFPGGNPIFLLVFGAALKLHSFFIISHKTS